MTNLKSRWIEDPRFQLMSRVLLDSTLQPDGMTREEWYAAKAPKTFHPTKGESLDYRAINLDGLRIGQEWIAYVFDDSSAVGCTFERTNFQSVSAQRCNFTGSTFDVAQMSPIYAPEANFRNCIFDTCFLMGTGPRHFSKGAFSDLRKCDFTGIHARKTGFDRCDFRGSCFINAHFTLCEFFEADLRDVDFSGAQFQQCDFRCAQFDDSLRSILPDGNNVGFE